MSSVNGVSSVSGLTGTLGAKEEEKTAAGAFSDMLSNAIKEADDAYVTASGDTQALLSGEVDNLAQVMINSSKAELSLNMVIQVRNKVVDAYNEIMRMQV